MTTLSSKQRSELKKYVLEACLSNMFGDGMEKEYILGGFPVFKGINHMTDDELLDEAGCIADDEEIRVFMLAIKEDEENSNV